MLFQDDVGGLEVETTQGVFVPVAPIPGTVVINIGDIHVTLDIRSSTFHREFGSTFFVHEILQLRDATIQY